MRARDSDATAGAAYASAVLQRGVFASQPDLGHLHANARARRIWSKALEPRAHVVAGHLNRERDRDLLWALLNTKEFLVNH